MNNVIDLVRDVAETNTYKDFLIEVKKETVDDRVIPVAYKVTSERGLAKYDSLERVRLVGSSIPNEGHYVLHKSLELNVRNGVTTIEVGEVIPVDEYARGTFRVYHSQVNSRGEKINIADVLEENGTTIEFKNSPEKNAELFYTVLREISDNIYAKDGAKASGIIIEVTQIDRTKSVGELAVKRGDDLAEIFPKTNISSVGDFPIDTKIFDNPCILRIVTKHMYTTLNDLGEPSIVDDEEYGWQKGFICRHKGAMLVVSETDVFENNDIIRTVNAENMLVAKGKQGRPRINPLVASVAPPKQNVRTPEKLETPSVQQNNELNTAEVDTVVSRSNFDKVVTELKAPTVIVSDDVTKLRVVEPVVRGNDTTPTSVVNAASTPSVVARPASIDEKVNAKPPVQRQIPSIFADVERTLGVRIPQNTPPVPRGFDAPVRSSQTFAETKTPIAEIPRFNVSDFGGDDDGDTQEMLIEEAAIKQIEEEPEAPEIPDEFDTSAFDAFGGPGM